MKVDQRKPVLTRYINHQMILKRHCTHFFAVRQSRNFLKHCWIEQHSRLDLIGRTQPKSILKRGRNQRDRFQRCRLVMLLPTCMT